LKHSSSASISTGISCPGWLSICAALAFATAENRTILTFNIRDFSPLHEAWQTAGRSHAGIIVSQQLGSREYGLLLQRMLRLLNHFTAEEMRANLVHLEQFK